MLLVRAEVEDANPPMLVWLHGRTAYKELDPGRYLRLMRLGVAICAIDLPGHGQRFCEAMQSPAAVLDVVEHMAGELDEAVEAAAATLGADKRRIALGGMSAGGMVAILRATRPHDYAALCLEATSGAWSGLPMTAAALPPTRARIRAADPMGHLDRWRPIPVLALHARYDEWIPQAAQWAFLDAIEALGPPSLIERVRYDRTGAEAEHAGFGSCAADAKERLCRFLARTLLKGVPSR